MKKDLARHSVKGSVTGKGGGTLSCKVRLNLGNRIHKKCCEVIGGLSRGVMGVQARTSVHMLELVHQFKESP